MNSLLISEAPLQVLPSLAAKIGLDKAVILQQIHYWCSKSANIRDGYKWVYNSVREWHQQFPWLSEKTVQRYLKDLERKGLLITGIYNKVGFDRTKWYRINYKGLYKLEESTDLANSPIGTHSPHLKGTHSPNQYHRLPETNNNMSSKLDETDSETEKVSLDFKEFFDYLNKVTGRSFKNIKSNQKLVSARLKAGYTKQDLKLVIDYKTSEWKGTEYEKYLQPSTLFRASKFDEYLNQAKLAVSKQKRNKTNSVKTSGNIVNKKEQQLEELVKRLEKGDS